MGPVGDRGIRLGRWSRWWQTTGPGDPCDGGVHPSQWRAPRSDYARREVLPARCRVSSRRHGGVRGWTARPGRARWSLWRRATARPRWAPWSILPVAGAAAPLYCAGRVDAAGSSAPTLRPNGLRPPASAARRIASRLRITCRDRATERCRATGCRAAGRGRRPAMPVSRTSGPRSPRGYPPHLSPLRAR